MSEGKTEERSSFEKLAPVLLIASLVLAFFVGVLWQKVNNLEKGGVAGANVEQDANAEAGQPPVSGELTSEQVERIPEVTDGDRIRGTGKVYFVEYSDLECPFCKKFHETMLSVMEKYEGKVVWVYRHFPLDMLHPKARTEAEAVECAYELGGNDGFWKLTDKIYEVTPANNGLVLEDLPKYADEVGLDGVKLQECIDSGKFKERVENQYQGGVSAGVAGTPGNFIITEDGRGWAIPGAVPEAQIVEILDKALAE